MRLTAVEAPLATHAASPTRVRTTAAVRGRRAVVVLALLTLALVATVLWSATVGQFPVTVQEILDSINRRIQQVPAPTPATDDAGLRMVQVDGSLWQIRFPRILLGLIVGACLGVAGCLTQGLFGNPLAEPSVIGTSAGAAVGACTVIVFGWGTTALGPLAQPMGAFIGAVVTTIVVYLMARTGLRTRVVTLILTGIAVNAVANAAIALLVFLADQTSRESIVFWQLGSLNGALWRAVATTAPLLTIGLLLALAISPALDLLALGENQARHLGVRVEVLRVVVVGLLALLTAAGVAFAGIIAFVGLIVPHLFRLLLGPSHRTLVPASALGGALLVALADLGARTLIPFADLPIGMFTALLGGPVFYLLMRRVTAGAEV